VAKTCSAFGKYIPRRARPAAAGFCSALSIAIYSRSFCSYILSPSTSAVHLSSFSSCCAPLFFLLLVLLLLPFDHRRCCQTTTCTPGPGQLPSCGHPFPSFSPSVPRAGITRPLRAHNLPFSLSYPHAVIYHRAIGFFPFSSSSTPEAAQSSSRLSVTFLYRSSHNVVLLLFSRLSFPNPFLPVRDDATPFINFRDANRR